MHLHIAGCHLPGIQEHRSTCRTLQRLNIWQVDDRNADHLHTHQYLKKDENSYKRKCFVFRNFSDTKRGGGEGKTNLKLTVFKFSNAAVRE